MRQREMFASRKIQWLLLAGALLLVLLNSSRGAAAVVPSANRSEVIIVEDPGATTAFIPNREAIPAMVEKGLLALANAESHAEAWRKYLEKTDVVGIKVYSSPGPTSGTRPVVVEALVSSLLKSGHPATNILIWDRRLSELRAAGFTRLAEKLGVQAAGALEEGYDPEVFYEHRILGKPVWGDLEFGKEGAEIGRKSYASKLLTKKLGKIINVTPLLNHNVGGVAGNLFSLSMASIDNNIRFQGSPELLAVTAPEIYAMPEIGDKVVLNIVDALICQYQGEETVALHYARPLNELRFSADPIALDVLSLEELNRQRRSYGVPVPKPPAQLFENAALLELGNSDLRKIQVERIGAPRREQSAASSRGLEGGAFRPPAPHRGSLTSSDS